MTPLRGIADIQSKIINRLLGRHLRREFQVLHGAAAAGAEMPAFRRGTQIGRLKDIDHTRHLKTGFLAVGFVGDFFTGQRAVDKNGFAFGVGDAAPFLVQRFN